MKICSKCKKEYPATLDYFYKTGNRLRSWCKECEKERCKKYYQIRQIKKETILEGFKICNKCKIEYPATLEYFAPVKKNKDGLYSYCRNCHREKNANWYLKNREIKLAKNMKYKKDNPKKLKGYSVIHTKRIKQATPKDIEIQRQIKEIYWNCPKGLTIDHVIPLKNNLVCGLHVPQNLNYLSGSENYSKNNNFKPYKEVLINNTWIIQV